jgi:hypothetical protein
MLGFGARYALPAFFSFWSSTSGAVKSADSFTSFRWCPTLQFGSLGLGLTAWAVDFATGSKESLA